MIAFVREDFEAEQKAIREQDKLVTEFPPPRPWKYDKRYLRFARDLEDSTGKSVLNPRNIYTASLEDVDLDWRSDLAAYRRFRRFFSDYDKRPFWQK